MKAADIAKPIGPFHLRICAGCGQQMDDGHHSHDRQLSPVYDVPAVPTADAERARADGRAWAFRLIEAIDELALWEPGRKGYAAALRRLRAERDWAWTELSSDAGERGAAR